MAGVLLAVQALGVVVLAVMIAVSGFRDSAAVAQLLAQVAFFLVVAAGLAACGYALFCGRRWGRSPGIVVQVIALAVGYWLTAPSGRLGPGLAVVGYALITGGLLLTPAANRWASQFALPGRSAPPPAQFPDAARKAKAGQSAPAPSARRAAPIRPSGPVVAPAKKGGAWRRPGAGAGSAAARQESVSRRPAKTTRDQSSGSATGNPPAPSRKKGPRAPNR